MLIANSERSGGMLGVLVEDWDRDGLSDILVSDSFRENFYIFRNQSRAGNISFLSPQRLGPSLLGGFYNVVAGDFDNDGDSDMAFTILTTQRSWVAVYINESVKGSIVFNSTPISVEVPEPWGLDVGDMDGDEYLDIVVASLQSSGPVVLINNGMTGSALDFTPLSFEIGGARNIRVGDMNGDGKPDIVEVASDRGDISEQLLIWTNRHCMQPVLTPDAGRACVGAPFFIEATPAPGLEYIWETRIEGTSGAFSEVARTTVPRFDIATLVSGNTYDMRVRYVLLTSTVGALCNIVSSNSSQIVASGTAPPAPTITKSRGRPNEACEGTDVTLEANVSGTPSQLLWEGPQGYSAEGSASITLPDISVDQAGKYNFYYVTAENCASERAEFTLSVRLLPFPQIFTSAPFSCEGATFSVDLATTDFPGLTYQWR